MQKDLSIERTWKEAAYPRALLVLTLALSFAAAFLFVSPIVYAGDAGESNSEGGAGEGTGGDGPGGATGSFSDWSGWNTGPGDPGTTGVEGDRTDVANQQDRTDDADFKGDKDKSDFDVDAYNAGFEGISGPSDPDAEDADFTVTEEVSERKTVDVPLDPFLAEPEPEEVAERRAPEPVKEPTLADKVRESVRSFFRDTLKVDPDDPLGLRGGPHKSKEENERAANRVFNFFTFPFAAETIRTIKENEEAIKENVKDFFSDKKAEPAPNDPNSAKNVMDEVVSRSEAIQADVRAKTNAMDYEEGLRSAEEMTPADWAALSALQQTQDVPTVNMSITEFFSDTFARNEGPGPTTDASFGPGGVGPGTAGAKGSADGDAYSSIADGWGNVTSEPSVDAASAGTACFFTVDKPAIERGEEVIGDWFCGAEGETQGIGFKSGGRQGGSIKGKPVETVTLGILCADRCQSTATVQVDHPYLEIRATPDRVHAGQTTTISWQGSKVATCSVAGPNFSGEGLTGSAVTPPIEFESVYALTCTTKLGSVGKEEVVVRLVPSFENL